MTDEQKVEALRSQGVQIPAPASIEIGDEVDLGQIRGPDTVLHAGTRLFGKELMILEGSRLGYEAPVTVDGCAVGRRVKLQGGFHAGAVYLDDAVVGSGAQVRAGTLLEEQAHGAHTVGLKQTVLLPFVTLGSLINFCDVLMAGGTSREDHSEVGSSFIHFNFTPFGSRGDKATASLIGDVPRGVMLRSKRIFLGGQAGLVGPVQVDYGTVLAAGFVYRLDHGPDELVVGERLTPLKRPFAAPSYRRLRGKVEKNVRYIGNLAALWQWYQQVRLPLAAGDPALEALYRRAQASVAGGIAERIKRLEQLAGYMTSSIEHLEEAGKETLKKEIADQRGFARGWTALRAHLEGYAGRSLADRTDHQRLVGAVAALSLDGGYPAAIRSLPESAATAGTAWLDAVVGETLAGLRGLGWS